MVEVQFTSSTIRLCSLNRNLDWDGDIFLGNGWLRPLRPIDETSEIRSVGVQIELVGVSSTLISLALQNVNQNLNAYIYLGVLDANGELDGKPLTLFQGKVDNTEIEDNLIEPSVIVQCESPLARLKRPQNFRYTDENQKALFPGDRGFEYVAKLEDWSGFWGKAERPNRLKKKRAK